MCSSPTRKTTDPALAAPTPQRARRGWSQRLGRALPSSLFWLTFAVVAALLTAALAVWQQAEQREERSQQLQQTVQQIDAIVSVVSAAQRQLPTARRQALFDDLVRHEDIYLYPRVAGDRWLPLRDSAYNRQLQQQAQRWLRQPLVFARAVNGRDGLWIGFDADGASTWLLLSPGRVLQPDDSADWIGSGLLVLLLATTVAAVIAHLLRRPLRALTHSAQQLSRGDYSVQLREDSGPRELRELSRSFNAMRESLQHHEQDRALMLAGISHDLRTPLARLRLEAELSVPDPGARDDIVADIEQADAILGQFIEYATLKLSEPDCREVDLVDLLRRVLLGFGPHQALEVVDQLPTRALVLADPVDLRRALVNLLQNASRYGVRPGQNHARVDLALRTHGRWVELEIRDHGPGVSAEQLPLLTRPFYRADTSRGQHQGTGLGLAIVQRALRRMQGRLELDNADGGGLRAVLQLRHPPRRRR